MNSKPQFDTLLGGETDPPIEVDTMKFATARAQEIAAISQALAGDSSKGQLIFQRLPRHMRRRVMGHNAKRMPRNLREAYTQQLLKSSQGAVSKHKKPSRKHRRRPANLLEEYNRRQRKHVWLETHIWHAKRFHMVEKWGYRMASYPNDRSYRACYRATANHCLLQDISFLCCIELEGPLQALISGLAQHTNSCCGPTFGAQSLLDGSREGDVMFFGRNEYPYKPVGKVSFFWKPCGTLLSSDARKLWIWAHPAFYQEIVDALITTFQLNLVPNHEPEADEDKNEKRLCDDATDISKKKIKGEDGKPKDVEAIKLAPRNLPFERTPKYSSSSGNVKMVLLKDTLNRFRLTGPLSQAVLQEALQLVDDVNLNFSASHSDDVEGKHQKCQGDQLCEQVSSSQLCGEDIDNEGRKSHHSFWLSSQGAASPAELPPRIILSLVVKDPRLQIPEKRTKASPATEGRRVVSPGDTLPLPYDSPLWSPNIRNVVTKSKLSTAALNSLRSKLLVPGLLRTIQSNGNSGARSSHSHIESSVKSRVPLFLVQRPGSQDPKSKRLGFGCGWDVILPASWAMPFWLSFIFRCARPSGLREASSHELERGYPQFLPPDSITGSEEESVTGKDLRDSYFRLPPNKRPNFIKLGVACPFQCEWSLLIRDWVCEISNSLERADLPPGVSEAAPSFFVLRDLKLLQKINEFLNTGWSTLNRSHEERTSVQTLLSQLPSYPNQMFSLLPVRVEALQKGVTEDMSLICIPSPEDVACIDSLVRGAGPAESPFMDNNHEERQRIKEEHTKLLLRLRRRRVRAKRKKEEDATDTESGTQYINNSKRPSSDGPPTQDVVAAFKERMQELWLVNTEKIGSIKNSCSRETAGFVTKGDFSFTEARGCGVGYITFASLKPLMERWFKHTSSERQECLKTSGVLVLVRSPKSFQFRLAKMNLIL